VKKINLGVEGTLLMSGARREDADKGLSPSWRSVLRSRRVAGRQPEEVVESTGWVLLSMEEEGDRLPPPLHSAMMPNYRYAVARELARRKRSCVWSENQQTTRQIKERMGGDLSIYIASYMVVRVAEVVLKKGTERERERVWYFSLHCRIYLIFIKKLKEISGRLLFVCE
jgi:hypothetical protein